MHVPSQHPTTEYDVILGHTPLENSLLAPVRSVNEILDGDHTMAVFSACPAGFYCPTTTRDTEIECPDGAYSIGNQSSCTVCPPGYECPRKTDNSEYVY
jgi:hypothetical protein